MQVIYKLTPKQISQLNALFQNEWWTAGRTLEETRRAVEGSQICIGLVDNNNLQGFVRVITDFTFKALILDLIVSPQYRGKGHGKKLLSLIKKHDELKTVKHFELYCLPALDKFYQKSGFSTDVGGVQFMRHINT